MTSTQQRRQTTKDPPLLPADAHLGTIGVMDDLEGFLLVLFLRCLIHLQNKKSSVASLPQVLMLSKKGIT